MAKRILYPFATSGDKTAVSDETQSDGVVSYQQGYGAQYSADIESDPTARRINRNRFNQVLFDITENTQEWQNQLYPDFILAADNGGSNYSYKQGMTVTDTNGDYKISLIDDNSDDTTTSNWADAWPVPVALGGTGAENAADARTNLGLGDVATVSLVPITLGGTGATTASQARINLGMVNVIVQQGRNSNGEYRIWNNGYREVWAIGLMPSGTTAPVTGTFPITFASLSTIRVMPSTEFITSQVAQGLTVPEAEVLTTSTYSYKALSLDANGDLSAPAEDIPMVTYAAGF